MATIKIPESLCISILPAFEHDPDSQATQKLLRQAVKTMIENATTDNLPPAALPVSSESGVSMNITFAATEGKSIRSLAKLHDIREGDAALKYLYAAIARGDAVAFHKANNSFMQAYTSALGKSDLHDQNVFADYLLNALSSTGIGMVEGSTGLGKTLSIEAACIEILKGKSFGRCVVTVPTIQLLRQFARQYREIENACLSDIPNARFIVGRGEFVCVSELEKLLSSGTELIDPTPIREWLKEGGLSLGISVDLQSRYLLSSLLAVSPTFPADAVRLSIDSDLNDLGAKAYAEQFERTEAEHETCEILFCTHAMLAADIRRRIQATRRLDEGQQIVESAQSELKALQREREQHDAPSRENLKAINIAIAELLNGRLQALSDLATQLDVGILPPWQHLVIDEAHTFESNLANTMSTAISLSRYVRQLGELCAAGIISKAALGRAKSALNLLKTKGGQDEYDLTTNSDVVREFRAALQEMSSAILECKQAATSTHPLLPIARLAANGINMSLRVNGGEQGLRALVCYSPVKAFPQLNIGRLSVRNELSFLWSSAASVACVSATLYLRKLDKDSASYSAGVLNIPPTRIREYPIVRPSWTHAPVIGLWTPEACLVKSRHWLRPPTRRDKLSGDAYLSAEATWLDETAQAVSWVFNTSAGGVLVLMGSYSAATGLAERLGGKFPTKVVASQKHTLQEQMDRFAAYGIEGKKALWIAVGAAWTGVDINGNNYGIADPTKDNLLTDLVIPRLPFSLNRSMTHRTRVESPSAARIPWELLDTAMRFKQGIGRLVRRVGLLKNRRIFVLDGRCNDPAFENYLSHLRRIMSIYTQKTLLFSEVEQSEKMEPGTST